MRPCPSIPGFECPMLAGSPCRGESDRRHCAAAREFVRRRESGAFGSLAGPGVGFDPGRHLEVRLLVLGCDYRGGHATECGCTKTRICLKGNGRPIPGSDARDVTDDDCLRCVGAAT